MSMTRCKEKSGQCSPWWSSTSRATSRSAARRQTETAAGGTAVRSGSLEAALDDAVDLFSPGLEPRAGENRARTTVPPRRPRRLSQV
jgi:hypothetical protein